MRFEHLLNDPLSQPRFTRTETVLTQTALGTVSTKQAVGIVPTKFEVILRRVETGRFIVKCLELLLHKIKTKDSHYNIGTFRVKQIKNTVGAFSNTAESFT
jgi:hypothetical protein